jgi:hypothetical protein
MVRLAYWLCTGIAGIVLGAGVAAADAPRDLDGYALLAIDELRVEVDAFIADGHIGVNDAGGEMAIDRRAFLSNTSAAVAASVRLDRGSSIFDLFTNGLSAHHGVIRGAGPTPFSVPIVAALPALPSFVPGAVPLIVGDHATATITPGSYSQLLIGDDSRVRMVGGEYQFETARVGRRAKLLVTGPSTINIQQVLTVGRFTSFGPADSGVGALEIDVNVGGPFVGIGAAAHVAIDLLAPNASLRFGRSFRGRGRFVARSVLVGRTVLIRDPGCGAPGECEDKSPVAPVTFRTLSQASYGAADGDANGPAGLVTMNPTILPVTIGGPGLLSLTVTDQDRLICFLPALAPPTTLCSTGACAGDMTIDACNNPPIVDFVPVGDGSSGGQGGGTLAGEVIAAKLNVALSKLGATPAGLGSFVLPALLCTTNCPFGRETDPIKMDFQKKTAGIADGLTSVDDLLALADQGLSQPCHVGTCARADKNAFAPPDPIRLSAIAAALAAVNECFEGGASIVPCP